MGHQMTIGGHILRRALIPRTAMVSAVAALGLTFNSMTAHAAQTLSAGRRRWQVKVVSE